jgi:NADH-quinone oxidoreductase subunit E
MSDEPQVLSLSPEAEARIDDLQSRYPTRQATLLHVLWEVQNQMGWIPEPWMGYAAERCAVSASHVLGVVSFYTMFRTRPLGRHHIEVCRNISCHIMGGKAVMDRVKERLGLGRGEVSGDGRFSFDEVECLAACSWGPMLAINGTYHENLDPAKVDEILDGLE